MADWANVDDYIDSLANRSQGPFHIDRSLALSAIGNYGSHWMSTGFPGAGVAPTTAATPTKATPGALANFTNPSGGNVMHLHEAFTTYGNSVGCIQIYDRLSHMGGLLCNITTPQTVDVVVTRGDTTGAHVVAYLECFLLAANSQQTWTFSYTNSAGVSGRTGTATMPANMGRGRMVPIKLQAGDLGVRSVQTASLGASALVAGNVGVVLGRRIVPVPTISALAPIPRIGLDIGEPVVEHDACLWMVVNSIVSSANGPIIGGLTLTSSG